MKFDVDMQVWLCAAEDEARPMLRYAMITRLSESTGTITCADGFVFARIPCELAPDEAVGLVRADVLEHAAKKHKNKTWRRSQNGMVTLFLDGDLVHLHPQAEYRARWHDANDKDGSYPDCGVLVTAEYLRKPMRTNVWAFFSEPHAKLSAALGREFLRLFCSDDSNLYVDCYRRDKDGNPLAPYGAFMGAERK